MPRFSENDLAALRKSQHHRNQPISSGKTYQARQSQFFCGCAALSVTVDTCKRAGQLLARPGFNKATIAQTRHALTFDGASKPGPESRTMMAKSVSAAFPDQFDHVLLVRHDAQELEILVAHILIPVRDAFMDEHNVAGPDLEFLAADANAGAPSQNVLLMLNRVGMLRHPAARPHDKTPHGKIGTLQQHLHAGELARLDRRGRDI